VEAGTVFTSKPAGGSADLTFTRSNDTATRVGPNGYIEKVRTNLLLQSNTFDTTWVTTDASVTSGQSGYDGTNNAWLLNVTGGTANQRIDQPIVLGGLNTYSIYLKAGTVDWVALRNTGSVSAVVWFNLANGTKGANPNSALNYTITSVGSGWYRCTLTLNSTTDRVYIYPSTADDFAGLNCTSGDNILIQSAQLETGDTATDYIETTTAAVSVGPVANVPRINFDPVLPRTGSLLLEPQRTNTLAYSEYFGAWSLSGGTLTANAEVSPQGVENAYLYTEDTSTNYHRINTGASASSSNKVYSVYAKWAGGTANRWFTIDNGPTAWFDIVNGVVGGAQGSVVTSIEDCGNGWYRCIYHNPTSTTGGIYLGIASSDGGSGNHVGNGQPAFYIYGAQCEDNVTYATSYIPTYGATATRGADTASKTGISSVIGQTEGTLFYDFVWSGAISATADYPIVLSGSDFNNFVGLNTTFNSNQLLAYSGGSIVAAIAGGDFVVGQRYKIALAYKANDFVYYLNGTLQGSDTSGAVPIGLANLEMVTPFGAKSTAQNATSILIFPTRLTNDQLSQITTL